jgi:hypothetical protein
LDEKEEKGKILDFTTFHPAILPASLPGSSL